MLAKILAGVEGLQLTPRQESWRRDIAYAYYHRVGVKFTEGEVVGLKFERNGDSELLIEKRSSTAEHTLFAVISDRAHTRIPLEPLDGFDATYAVCIIGTVPVRVDHDVHAGETIGIQGSGDIGEVAEANCLGRALEAGGAGAKVSCFLSMVLQPLAQQQGMNRRHGRRMMK